MSGKHALEMQEINTLRCQLTTQVLSDNITLGIISHNVPNPKSVFIRLLELGINKNEEITLLYRQICKCNPDQLQKLIEKDKNDPEGAVKKLEVFFQKK